MGDLGDTIERLCAHKAAFWIFTLAFAIGVFVNVDIANILISYFTAGLLLLTMSGQRRSNKAIHAKLDGLIDAADEADDSLERLEDRTEREIEAKRP